MNGIEFLLTHKIAEWGKHECGWWWVLSNELLQQDILHVLCTESPNFTHALVGHGGMCVCPSRAWPVGWGAKPPFDLAICDLGSGQKTCLEIKVHHHWKEGQRKAQVRYLSKDPRCVGRLVVFASSANCWTSDSVSAACQNTARGIGCSDPHRVWFTKVSYTALYHALGAIDDSQGALGELASAYGVALRKHEARMKAVGQDPNR